jgi:hypothetical protein
MRLLQQTFGETKRPEVDRSQPRGLRLGTPDRDLCRGAAKVDDSDERRGLRGHGDRAGEPKPGLLLRREDAHADAGRTLERSDEIGRVLRLPAGCGDEDVDGLGVSRPRTRAQLLDGLGGCGHRRRREAALRLELAPQAELDALRMRLLELRLAYARDKESNGVRSDVDDSGRARQQGHDLPWLGR